METVEKASNSVNGILKSSARLSAFPSMDSVAQRPENMDTFVIWNLKLLLLILASQTKYYHSSYDEQSVLLERPEALEYSHIALRVLTTSRF